jgi:hypothetical protein
MAVNLDKTGGFCNDCKIVEKGKVLCPGAGIIQL